MLSSDDAYISSCRDLSQTQQVEPWGRDRQYEVESKEMDISLALHPGQSATDRSKVIPMLHVQHVYTYFYIRMYTRMHPVHAVLVYINSKLPVPKAL